jgi:hypothetical protein
MSMPRHEAPKEELVWRLLARVPKWLLPVVGLAAGVAAVVVTLVAGVVLTIVVSGCGRSASISPGPLPRIGRHGSPATDVQTSAGASQSMTKYFDSPAGGR